MAQLPVPTNEGPSSDFLLKLASDPAIDAGKLEALASIYINMQEKQRAWAEADEKRQALLAYLDAKAQVQAQLPVIGRDAQNEQTRSRYTRFETIWETCCPIWSKHGFSVSFDVSTLDSGLIRVKLLLEHKGGHIEEFLAPDTPSDTAGPRGHATKTAVQGNQSTVTYVQRGLLCRALGIAMKGFDDDGNASHRARPEPEPPVADTKYPTLEEPNGSLWVKHLEVLLSQAPTHENVEEIGQHHSVIKAFKDAPTLIKARMQDMFAAAHQRLDTPAEPAPETEEQQAHRMVGEVGASQSDEGLKLLATQWKAIMTDWKMARPELFGMVDAAVATRRKELREVVPG